jgi:hypothetical protein
MVYTTFLAMSPWSQLGYQWICPKLWLCSYCGYVHLMNIPVLHWLCLCLWCGYAHAMVLQLCPYKYFVSFGCSSTLAFIWRKSENRFKTNIETNQRQNSYWNDLRTNQRQPGILSPIWGQNPGWGQNPFLLERVPGTPPVGILVLHVESFATYLMLPLLWIDTRK